MGSLGVFFAFQQRLPPLPFFAITASIPQPSLGSAANDHRAVDLVAPDDPPGELGRRQSQIALREALAKPGGVVGVHPYVGYQGSQRRLLRLAEGRAGGVCRDHLPRFLNGTRRSPERSREFQRHLKPRQWGRKWT